MVNTHQKHIYALVSCWSFLLLSHCHCGYCFYMIYCISQSRKKITIKVLSDWECAVTAGGGDDTSMSLWETEREKERDILANHCLCAKTNHNSGLVSGTEKGRKEIALYFFRPIAPVHRNIDDFGASLRMHQFFFVLMIEFENRFRFQFRFGKYLVEIILCILLVTQFFPCLSPTLFKLINSFCCFFSWNHFSRRSMLLKQHSFQQITYLFVLLLLYPCMDVSNIIKRWKFNFIFRWLCEFNTFLWKNKIKSVFNLFAFDPKSHSHKNRNGMKLSEIETEIQFFFPIFLSNMFSTLFVSKKKCI